MRYARWKGSSACRCFAAGTASVTLTEAGERFHADVTLGLSHIRKSAEDLRARAAKCT